MAADELALDGETSVRLDRWLFAVRIYKSRSLAAKAVAAGRIKINGQTAKPHRPTHVGDKITLKREGVALEYEVVELIEKRVGAKQAQACYRMRRDPGLSPEMRDMAELYRKIDAGRRQQRGKPTKRDRRLLQKLKDPDESG